MNEVLAMIERLVEEHKLIRKETQTIERIANDASALKTLEEAKGGFMPGKPEHVEGLKILAESLEKIEKGLHIHFDWEEKAVLSTVDKEGGKQVKTAFQSLLEEHDDLRKRFARAKQHVEELTGGDLSRHVWEANAHDMRAHISHTRKLLEIHAQGEEKLFASLRKQLKKQEA